MNENIKLTPEQIEKVKAAPSIAALITLAKENNIQLSEQEAAMYFSKLHPEYGALDDEALDAVAGGAGGDDEHTKPCNFV